MIDFYIHNHGTIYLVEPGNDAAADWLAARVDDDATWLGDMLAVGHRFIRDLTVAISQRPPSTGVHDHGPF